MASVKGANDSIEILISDLIFKLGKAHQQIHQLTIRIANLEETLRQEPSSQPLSSHPRPVKRVHVQ